MQIDWWTLGLQTVNFLIVIWLLSRFLYRPIRKVIADREAADRAATEAAEAKVRAADEAKQAYQAKLDAFEAEKQVQITSLHETLEAERAKRLAEVQAEAEAALTAGRAKIAAEKATAQTALRSEIVALAEDLARKALSSVGDDPLTAATRYLDGLAPMELDGLRQQLGPDAAVIVISAQDFGDKRQAKWRTALVTRLGPDVPVAFQQDASLLAGVELHFPHAALRFSAADRLHRAASALET